ncbi:hypothetical protein AX16_010204 [Volvariella volvacea WC 439]|nr:hypothetical protein AX16_010204 [Volvariella volvacea WC 439]
MSANQRIDKSTSIVPTTGVISEEPLEVDEQDIGDLSNINTAWNQSSSTFFSFEHERSRGPTPASSQLNLGLSQGRHYTPPALAKKPSGSSSKSGSPLPPPHSIETRLVPKRSASEKRLNSPSSPTVNKVPRPDGLVRSQTLPRTPSLAAALKDSKIAKVGTAFDGLTVDLDIVKKIRRWIVAIAVVDFDLDMGPVLSGVYPPLSLTPSEGENIAFASFPDSSQFDQGSQTHSFRIRESGISNTSDTCPVARPFSEDGFLYGFAHFTQQRDESSKRGYLQRSSVILTHRQLPAFFTSMVSVFGPLYHTHGLPMLEAACHNIAVWPDPTPGRTVELGFLGSVLHLEIPHSINEQQSTETSSFHEAYDPKRHILGSSAPLQPPPILLFEASLSNLWSIWECLILCEPILIFGNSPAQTSQAVWWLRDLLRPIPLTGDIRPYFTVQDGDHTALVNKLPPKSGTLLGVTNPFFEKSCTHWPHMLCLGRKTTHKVPNAAGPVPGWKTKTHRRYISKDKALLKTMEDSCISDDRSKMTASLQLRRHFYSRTTAVLTPLARYLNTLIPSPAELTTARSTNANQRMRLKPFNSDHFFASLKKHGSTLPFKSNSKRTEFYERWLKTPAFGLWLAQQESIVQDVLLKDQII